MNEITLAVKDGHITTTSTQVAEHFGRQHKSVLRAIGRLECSPEFGRRNFAPSSYINDQGKEQPAYRLTRDGFTFLCMGFTGKDAAAWKEKYIAAFNAMEAKLKVGAGATAQTKKALLAPRDPISKALHTHINRVSHQLALKQYDTIQSILTGCVLDNLACGAKEADCFGYVEATGELADGTVLVNLRDLQELVSHTGRVIDAAGTAIAAIKRIEQRSGFQLYHRLGNPEYATPEFHKHDRLIDKVIDQMV